MSEGWFDNTGWRPDEGVDETNRWFPRTPNETYAVFGANRSWAAEQWSEAYRRWKEHGEANGLVIEPGRFQAIREAAGGDVGSLPQRPTDTELRDDAAVRRRYAARLGLFYYERNRTVTNFPFFLMNAEAEMQPTAMAARKALWNAELARTSGNTNQAIRRYAEAFELWKTWLSQYEAYSRNDALQEEMFEAEYRYVRLLTQDDPQVRNMARARYENLMRAVIPGLPSVPPADERIMSTIRQQIAEREISPFGKPKPNGEPWISDQAKENVRIRLGSTTKLTASDDTK